MKFKCIRVFEFDTCGFHILIFRLSQASDPQPAIIRLLLIGRVSHGSGSRKVEFGKILTEICQTISTFLILSI